MTNLDTRSAVRVARSETRDPDRDTDGELVARWTADSDRGALELLIRRHGGMVLGVCRRVLGDTPDADDAFQATFLVLVRKARSLAAPEQVAGWLHGVALRSPARRGPTGARRGREVVVVDLIAPTPPRTPRTCARARRGTGPPAGEVPAPIVLCELEGRTLEEAARLLGWPVGTVAGGCRAAATCSGVGYRAARLALPLFLAGPTASDPLVSATLQTTTAGPESASRPRCWPMRPS